MHELSLMQNIFTLIEQIARKQNLRSITQVEIKIGQLRQVEPEFLQFAFETLAKGTIAEGAKLIIECVPVQVLCYTCNKKFIVEENVYVCPHCCGTNLEILTGKELILESVSGEKENIR